MRLAAASALALVLFVSVGPLAAQDPIPDTPVEKFRSARDLIADGKLDLAAVMLKSFVDSPPGDQDFLDLEEKFGPSVFQKLLRVVRWSENPQADAAARATVDAIIRQANDVNRRVAQNPARIKKYVANLGKSAAERAFAIDQLIPAGEAAVPEIVSALRSTTEPAVKAGILASIPELPARTIPVFLAAIDPASDLGDDVRIGVLNAIAVRPDFAQLAGKVESDPMPLLWRYASQPTGELPRVAVGILQALTGGLSERRAADAELLRLSEPLITRRGDFLTLDALNNTVRLWSWAGPTGPKLSVVSKVEAEEYYALKYLRWAVQANPKNEAAQLAFLAVATERAVERHGFGDLRPAEPKVYQLLAAAPDRLLSALLDQALTESRTALAVGVLLAMSDRGQKDEPGTGGRPSAYARGLQYPDPRVRLAAALAMLRSPGEPTPGAASQVVDVLRRALGGQADPTQPTAGRVLIVDPFTGRGDRLAAQFRGLGFATESYTSGRDLLRRVAKASDFDLIAIDRHVSNPLLHDVVSHLAADPNAGRRPVLVVASADKVTPPPLEVLLLRLAVLVAATETPAEVPPVYAYDPKFPPTQKPGQSLDQAIETARFERYDERNSVLYDIAGERLKRLQRLVGAADLPTSLSLSERLDVRLPQLSYGVLAAEFDVLGPNPPRPPITALDPRADAGPLLKEDADRRVVPPDVFLILKDLNDLLRVQGPAPDVTDTAKLGRLIEQIEGELDAPTKARFDALLAKVAPGALLVDTSSTRDLELEVTLKRKLTGFRGVAVLPEPFSPGALAEDLRQLIADPARLPRADAEKLASAKLAARWLGKIATGAAGGYTISTAAESDMRVALGSDDLAPLFVEGMAELGSGDTQVALVQLSANTLRPLDLRVQAADAAARHVQKFGRHTPADAAQVINQAIADEQDPVLRGKLLVLARLVAPAAADFGAAVSGFDIPIRTPAPKDPMPPVDPPEGEK